MRARWRRVKTRLPANAANAGSRVTAMITAMRTVAAAATAISVRNGMLTTDRPTRATMTVRPAKNTAEPAVPTARPIASARVALFSTSPRTASSLR